MLMADMFWWIGVGATSALVVVIAFMLALLVVALWQNYGPKFHWRAPLTEMVITTYRGDVRTGEGKRVKIGAPDLRISYVIGMSWRFKFLVGLMILKEDNPE